MLIDNGLIAEVILQRLATITRADAKQPEAYRKAGVQISISAVHHCPVAKVIGERNMPPALSEIDTKMHLINAAGPSQ